MDVENTRHHILEVYNVPRRSPRPRVGQRPLDVVLALGHDGLLVYLGALFGPLPGRSCSASRQHCDSAAYRYRLHGCGQPQRAPVLGPPIPGGIAPKASVVPQRDLLRGRGESKL